MKEAQTNRISRTETEDRIIEVEHFAWAPRASSVRIYFKRQGLDIFYTTKSCVCLTKFWNGSTPESSRDEDVDSMHVCSVSKFIELLQEAERVAAEHWKPIGSGTGSGDGL